MPHSFASEKKAFGFCDQCFFRYPLKKLRTLTVKGRIINLRVCPECWDPDHPQLWVGVFPIDDPQALRNARPDIALNEERGLFAFNPVATQVITTTLNTVFITIN
jgi:hypothetical protein